MIILARPCRSIGPIICAIAVQLLRTTEERIYLAYNCAMQKIELVVTIVNLNDRPTFHVSLCSMCWCILCAFVFRVLKC